MLQQAINSRSAPGVSDLVLNPMRMPARRAGGMRDGFADAYLSGPVGVISSAR